MKQLKDNLEKVPDKKVGISIDDCLPRIQKLVDFYGRKFNAEVLGTPVDDMFQEAVYQLLRTKYLERYDYTRPIHVYLSGFIYNLFCHAFKRGMSSVAQAESIERGSEATSFSVLTRVGTTDERLDDAHEYKAIIKLLDSNFKPTLYTIYDTSLHFICVTDTPTDYECSIQMPHSHSLVFSLLYQGLSAMEIKQTLHMPPPEFTLIMKELAQVSEIRSWADSKGFRINRKI